MAQVNCFRLQLFRFLFQSRNDRGFTLTELLVSILISGIIVTGLLALVVDLLQNEQRDVARNDTQRDVQMAMDFIAQDIREAVYVYTNRRMADYVETTVTPNATVQRLPNFLPDVSGQPDNLQPILVFWKPEFLPYQVGGAMPPADCVTAFPNPAPDVENPLQQECVDLRVSRRTYSLVAYYQTSTANPGGANRGAQSAPWRGRSRIMRYVLRKYSNPTTLTRNPGYVDPVQEAVFETWPYDTSYTSRQTTRPAFTGTVLADFIDHPANPHPRVRTPDLSPTIANDDCPPNDAGITARQYFRSTPAGQDANYKSFYACVRDRLNSSSQDVVLYLRGSVWGRQGYPVRRAPITNAQDPGFLPALQTQVLVRGILN